MANQEFSEGDKVRVIQSCCQVKIGETGTIRDGRFYNDDRTGFDHHFVSGMYNLRLDLIQPTGLKTGDRVEYFNGQPGYVLSMVGWKGTVETVGSEGVCNVIWDNGDTGLPFPSPKNIRKVEEKTEDVLLGDPWSATQAGPKLSPQDIIIKEQREEMLRLQTLLMAAEQLHKDNIQTLGDELISAANDNDLCEQFDMFVTRVNRELKFPLPRRERDFWVDVEFCQRIYVSATSENQARGRARESDEYGQVNYSDEAGIEVGEEGD